MTPTFQSNSASLYLGDCLEVMPQLEAGSVDMVLADLPYGTTGCAWDAVIPFDGLWQSYERVCRPGAAILLTASQPFTSALVMSRPRWFQCEWIWEKNLASNFGSAKTQPLKEHESVLVFRRPGKGRIYNPIRQERSAGSLKNVGKVVNSTVSQAHHTGITDTSFVREPLSELRLPRSVQRFDTHRRAGGLHPTQKPVSLLGYMVRTYTNEGDTVLDNTMGSGSTGVASMKAGRQFVGIEKDPTFFATAERRIRTALAPPDHGPLFAEQGTAA